MFRLSWLLGLVACGTPSTPTASASTSPAQDEKALYPLGPDSQRKEGVPRGTITKFTWKSSIFAGTTREVQVYAPPGADGKTPLPLMVFQDGGGYASETGPYRVPVVLDNLIHQKRLPPMAAIFVNPGQFPPKKEGDKPGSNRSFEYDSLGDQYVRFLLEEILPEAGKTLNLSKEAKDRGIGGASSGGICAFTAAWERPDAFSKVLSHVGSFTNLRGGHVYPSLIRKTAAKPIRVFLQDGSNDLDNAAGNWPLANREMAAALAFKKYDHQFVFGEGKHSGVHGGAILPESLEWLWRP
jgi:enterochelin esterase family protein